jgi:hypothetical protein
MFVKPIFPDCCHLVINPSCRDRLGRGGEMEMKGSARAFRPDAGGTKRASTEAYDNIRERFDLTNIAFGRGFGAESDRRQAAAHPLVFCFG